MASFIRHPVGTGRRAAARLRAPSIPEFSEAFPPGPAQQAFADFTPGGRGYGAESTVVILTLPTVREPVARWAAYFRGARVVVIAPDTLPEWHLEALGARHHRDSDMTKLNWHLKVLGAVDVIIDLTPRPIPEQKASFFQLFWHLKPGGMYVIDTSATLADSFSRATAGWLNTLVGADDAESPSDSPRNREVSNSVNRVTVSRDLIAIEKRNKHYLKLREAETNRVLPTREPGLALDVLARMPKGTFESRARVTSYESTTPMLGLDGRIEHPELSLRHYRGEIAMVSNQLLYTGHTVLSDSFVHHLDKDLANFRITSVIPNFARIQENSRPSATLHGDYYHIDSQNSGHFGHLLTESVARLWGWNAAKERFPDLKLLFRTRFPNERDTVLERRIFSAFGVDEKDIVWSDQPVYLESVVAATPMWHNSDPFYVHPQIKSTVWDVIADRLIDPDAPNFPRIFVSRKPDRRSRRCRNDEAVSALFEAHGFEIVYPELFDLATQAGIFANARVIAGYGGSAMFNMMFARNLETAIVLNQESYTARGEHLITSFFDCDVHYFWSPPDPPEPDGDRFKGGFYSTWEFDFARNGAALAGLLASL